MKVIVFEGDYAPIQPLFAPLADLYPFCACVLAGITPGRILVDDADAPRSGFLLTREVWGYLAGAPDNADFNRALNDAFRGGGLLPSGDPMALLHWHPDGWAGALPALAQPGEPYLDRRRRYLCERAASDWPPPLADGFALRPLDETLRSMVTTDLPSDLRQLLDWRRGASDPDQIGFGFAAMEGDRLAAYALVDAVAGTVGEIGLFTEETYRRRGLARAVSAATLDYGLARGLERIVWDCSDANTGSVRLAEQLRLRLDGEHPMAWIGFD